VLATSSTDSSRQWVAARATAGNVSFVGIENLSMSADDLLVAINTPDSDGHLIDYSVAPFSVATGPDSSMTVDFDAADGALLQASATLDIDLFGFVLLNGSFAISKSETQITLADTDRSKVDVELLTIGATGVNAFAGVNGHSSDRTGLALSDLEFGLALATSKTDSTRRWTALSASAAGVELVGVTDVTLSATDLSLAVNRPDVQGTVIDFAESFLSVETGTDSDGIASTVTIDFDGSRGPLLEAAGTLTIGVGDFFNVNGSLTINKSAETLALSDGSTVDVELLTIGGTGIDAFAGVNYATAQATGLSLSDTEFALVMAADKNNTARKWTTLQAGVGEISIVGITGLTIEATDLAVLINRPDTVTDLVVDYSSDPLYVSTSATESITVDLDGDRKTPRNGDPV
jgi:hypothetical protein